MRRTAIGPRKEPFFRNLRLRREELDPTQFPLSIPAVQHCEKLRFHPCVTVLAGENGSGKSTLIEAIALAAGFSPAGGRKSFQTPDTGTDLKLADQITLGRCAEREDDGFFLRAESVFGLSSYLNDIGQSQYYGGDLHTMSHGESFISIFLNRFRAAKNCLFILDEVEAALSPQRQLEFLGHMHEFVMRGSMFIISTHSPILMSYPNSRLFWLDEDGIEERGWQDTPHLQTYQAFINRHDLMLDVILGRQST